MTEDREAAERSFLRRWSQRKLAAAREVEANESPAPTPPAGAAAPAATAPVVQSVEGRPAQSQPAIPELPPVESLTFESDFTAYLRPSVDPMLKRAALRKLFADPRFNVMDGLDVYIDDYNKFEPMPPEIVKQLAHARYLFDPPKTRVNALGHVEDIPEDELVAAAEAPESDANAPDSDPQDDAQPVTGSEGVVASVEPEAAPGDVPVDEPSAARAS